MRPHIAGKSTFEILDLPCPACGPYRQAATNRIRRVMRIWTRGDGTQAFSCIRCGAKGILKSDAWPAPDGRAPSTADEQRRMKLALRLWRASAPLPHTPAEAYLRRARSYQGPHPATLRYLPASVQHPHALIAAFGLAMETADGALVSPDTPPAVHLTRLTPDGMSRLNKMMIGRVSGHPLVLAPVNNGLGLVVTEGMEDALSLHEATGLGAWAAGSAIHMNKLAATVPGYVSCVTLAQDNDDAGRTATKKLAAALVARGFEVRILSLANLT